MVNGLRRALELAKEKSGYSAQELTVLSNQHDPFRLDTPAGHRDGRWYADAAAEIYGHRRFHNRGLHYKIIGRTKPNGRPYRNTRADLQWLQEGAAKAGRWLGYVPGIR